MNIAIIILILQEVWWYFIGDIDVDGASRKKEDVNIVVALKYLINFGRSLEMPLIVKFNFH